MLVQVAGSLALFLAVSLAVFGLSDHQFLSMRVTAMGTTFKTIIVGKSTMLDLTPQNFIKHAFQPCLLQLNACKRICIICTLSLKNDLEYVVSDDALSKA